MAPADLIENATEGVELGRGMLLDILEWLRTSYDLSTPTVGGYISLGVPNLPRFGGWHLFSYKNRSMMISST